MAGSEECKRLEILAAYGIMNTPAEEEFNSITRLAALVCNTPIALITFVDHERQWFKSKVGLALPQTPRSQAFCHYTIQGDDVLEVPDARHDERFLDNPLVTGEPHIRYYCGVPLTTPEGYRLGSLCVIDRQPRQLNDQQRQALVALAGEVMAQLELKRQKKELEKQNALLAQSQHQLKALFEHTPGYLFTHDLQGIITSVNPAGALALGYEKASLEGKNAAVLLAFENKDRYRAYLRKIRTGQPVSGVTTIRTASGSERHWLYRNFCYQAPGNQGYVICSAHDITDEEEARRRLQQLNESLTTQVRSGKEALVSTHTDLNRTKAELDAFLYRSSHDLMGPLCSLKGLLHLAQAESPQGSLEPYFGLLHQSLHKLEHVLNHLRTHSNNKQHELQYEPVDFDALLARAVAGCSQVKGFNRISLHTEVEGDTPVVTDRERLLVVLKSLLANSIAFQNFSIPDPRVHVSITATPDRVRICVADNGIGIPADKLDSIFKLFDRSSAQSQGAGLGLYIAKEVVETLAGTIRVQSHPGVGSTFVVEVPNCLPASGDHEAVTHEPPDGAGTTQ